MNKIFDNLYANIGKHRRNRIENYAQYGHDFAGILEHTGSTRFLFSYPLNTRNNGKHEEKNVW